MIESVYIIYSADILGTDSEIDGMGPAKHVGTRGAIASAFVETEGNEQYDYGYLADGRGDTDYYPLGYMDAQAFTEPDDDKDDLEGIGLGCHRKWVGELTLEQWRIFADAYCIDLDDDGFPERCEQTMGSLTAEHGHIPAVSVDNSEGWMPTRVIASEMYCSFAMTTDESEAQ